MRRRGTALVATLLATAVGCTVIPGIPPSQPDGYVDPGWFTSRQDDYLAFATEVSIPSSPLNVLAHAERADRDPDFVFDDSGLTLEAYADTFERIDTMTDTTDFTMLYLLNLWYSAADRLPADLRAAIEQRIVAFKYWYTEPQPDGIIDDKIYWTENHRLIFAVIEYMAGQAFPDTVFTNDGTTGAAHRDRAAVRIDEWIDEKVRFGFSEWHSDVYYQKDLTPLLSLVEWADDGALALRSSMLIDIVLFDIALHLQEGNFGATHGRSYMKDKSTAVDQDVFGLAKLIFDDTSEPYKSHGDAGATLFARAKKYQLPQILLRVARSPATSIDRQRMNVPVDPLAPITAVTEAPYGIDFDDPANLDFWWERGTQTIWQGQRLTLATADQYNLWETMQFKPFVELRDLTGGDPLVAQQLARSLAPFLAFALLSEVNTYTYRSSDAMLSSAQSYRPGMFGEQYHAWQATLDEEALVFTTHPKYPPAQGTSWPDRDGYWTGTGSMPRSAQQGSAAIHMYAPQFVSPGPPLDAFSYQPQTHAYFPIEKFDEVIQSRKWTFGRKDDGYVALYSWRPANFRAAAPGEFTHGMTEPFDLVADGGSDNVWIVEVGDKARWGSFRGFRKAMNTSRPQVTRRQSTEAFPAGFDVTYQSPSQGEMRFGWTGPLTVDGTDVPIDGYARFDNPWSQTPFEARSMTISDGDSRLLLDFDGPTRTASSGPPG